MRMLLRRVRYSTGVALIAWSPVSAVAQSFAPYSDFQTMSVADLATLRMKLTLVGDVGSSPPAVLFATSQANLNGALFVPYRRPDFAYVADEMRPHTCIVSAALFKVMIDSVATLGGVTDGNVDTGGDVSFSLLNTAGGTKAFEAIVDSSNGQALLGKLIAAFKASPAAVRSIRQFGCGIGMLPHGAPSEVTGVTTVVAEGLRLDRLSSRYVGKVKVTNASGAPIAAPILLLISTSAEAGTAEADGATCNIAPAGVAYVALLGAGTLAGGASVERTLHITNPGRVKLNVSYRVFSGAGTP